MFHSPRSAPTPKRHSGPRVRKTPDVEAKSDADALDNMFHALADASRRSMVERLARGPATVTELGSPLAMGMPAVLKHLGVLEAGGLVVSEKSGRVRTYRMTADALALAERWILVHRARLDRDLGGGAHHPGKQVTRPAADEL